MKYAFKFGAGLTLLSLLALCGCGTMHKVLHPFSSATSAVAQVLPAPPPVPGPSAAGASAPATAAPMSVKLPTGQIVQMVPAPAPAPAKATPVKNALSKLLILVWVCGIIGILVGVAFIVWLNQLWLGIKLIGCCIGGIIFAEWFYVHYVGTIAVLLIAGAAWIVLDHFVTWSSLTKWIEKQENTIKKNV